MTTSPTAETHSVAETIAFGAALARQLAAGAVLALSGELGSGKTCLVKGLARGLGITAHVTSPTFTIIHQYYGGRLPLAHIDLYRLDSIQQALATGIEEHLSPAGVTVIEWAEKIAPLLPANALRIHLAVTGETTRRIEIR
jgi:tRNA threonylcarbamoyladenosine biosynthesis protein TsaE